MSSFHLSQTGGQCESIDHRKCLVFIPATSTSPGSLPNMLGTPSQTTCFRSWRRLPQLSFNKAVREVISDKSQTCPQGFLAGPAFLHCSLILHVCVFPVCTPCGGLGTTLSIVSWVRFIFFVCFCFVMSLSLVLMLTK